MLVACRFGRLCLDLDSVTGIESALSVKIRRRRSSFLSRESLGLDLKNYRSCQLEVWLVAGNL